MADNRTRIPPPRPADEAVPPPPVTPRRPSEFVMLGRWSLGLALVLVCGWGAIGFAWYELSSHGVKHYPYFVALVAAFSLGVFFFLERDHWLSRFMGLRHNPAAPGWDSAILFWLLNVPGVLFRSTQPPETQTAAEPSGAGAPPRTQAPPQPTDSFREVLETVVFVIVLVLLLKSFVAEAFVIPTGSMATTLLGYQKNVICPKCGFEFPVNCSEQVEGRHHPYVAGGVCPNCRYHVNFPEDRLDPSCDSGDRVLVAKFLYDSGLMPTHRLDVVVFKYPKEPQKDNVPMNYIKRLIGLPGETIGIYYGKLYVLPPGQGKQYPGDQEVVRPQDLWHDEYMHTGDSKGLLTQRNSPFQILRKPPAKILAVRRPVYDNDHPAKDFDVPRWVGEASAWADDGGRGFHHAAGQGGIDWLRYRNVLRPPPGGPDGPPRPELITDFMGYNSKAFGGGFRNEPQYPVTGYNWVGDLILECDVTVDQPAGDLVFELSKGVDRFRATWDLATGTCTLTRLADGREATLDAKPTKLSKPGTYRVRFANVDERLVVWVDNNLPFGDGVAYDAPETRGPSRNDFEPASIGSRGGAVRVSHLQLWRDTYYTVGVLPPADSTQAADARTEQELHELLSDPDRAAAAFSGLKGNTYYVQPNHYLCLGDNSPESSDGRSWGLVPRRLLLGRALMVYFPFPPVGATNRVGPIQ